MSQRCLTCRSPVGGHRASGSTVLTRGIDLARQLAQEYHFTVRDRLQGNRLIK